MGKQEHRTCASRRPQWKQDRLDVEIAWDLETKEVQCVGVGILTGEMSTRAEGKRTMGIDVWQRRWQGTSLRDLDRARERGQPEQTRTQGEV